MTPSESGQRVVPHRVRLFEKKDAAFVEVDPYSRSVPARVRDWFEAERLGPFEVVIGTARDSVAWRVSLRYDRVEVSADHPEVPDVVRRLVKAANRALQQMRRGAAA